MYENKIINTFRTKKDAQRKRGEIGFGRNVGLGPGSIRNNRMNVGSLMSGAEQALAITIQTAINISRGRAYDDALQLEERRGASLVAGPITSKYTLELCFRIIEEFKRLSGVLADDFVYPVLYSFKVGLV